MGELARKLGGHGGMDFIMVYRLWSASARASCRISTSTMPRRGAPRAAQREVRGEGGAGEFPDFTRGRWKEKRGWLA